MKKTKNTVVGVVDTKGVGTSFSFASASDILGYGKTVISMYNVLLIPAKNRNLWVHDQMRVVLRLKTSL